MSSLSGRNALVLVKKSTIIGTGTLPGAHSPSFPFLSSFRLRRHRPSATRQGTKEFFKRCLRMRVSCRSYSEHVEQPRRYYFCTGPLRELPRLLSLLGLAVVSPLTQSKWHIRSVLREVLGDERSRCVSLSGIEPNYWCCVQVTIDPFWCPCRSCIVASFYAHC